MDCLKFLEKVSSRQRKSLGGKCCNSLESGRVVIPLTGKCIVQTTARDSRLRMVNISMDAASKKQESGPSRN